MKKEPFSPPDWLVHLCEQGDWGSVHLYTIKQIRDASVPTPPPADLLLPNEAKHRVNDEALLARMVSVGDGPEREDRTQRALKSRLYIDRNNPERLLIALALNHPPSLWVPAGKSRETVDAVLATYCFPGMSAQETLPFQKRLFLTTTSMLGDDFRGVENRLARSAFCDSLIWGSNNPTDPYPEKVTLGRIPLPDLRRYLAQAPGELPRTSIRTRFSRAIIQVIDFQDGYFADLFFQPAPHPELGTEYNARFGTDFPPATPIDLIATLSGFTCLGPDKIRYHMEAAQDPGQRQGLQTILEFMERVTPGHDEEMTIGVDTPTYAQLSARIEKLKNDSNGVITDKDIATGILNHANGRPLPEALQNNVAAKKLVALMTHLFAREGAKSDAWVTNVGMLLQLVLAGGPDGISFQDAFTGRGKGGIFPPSQANADDEDEKKSQMEFISRFISVTMKAQGKNDEDEKEVVAFVQNELQSAMGRANQAFWGVNTSPDQTPPADSEDSSTGT